MQASRRSSLGRLARFVLSTSWFGGEPLLARDVIYELSQSFLSSCREREIGYRSSITTNGYFLTPDVVENLLHYEVRQYQVTLDGPERVHDTTRKLIGGGGTYKQILANLVRMRQMDAQFTVKVRVNFSQRTVPHLDDFLGEMTSLFCEDDRFNLDFHPVGKWGGPNDSVLDVCDADSAEAVKLGLFSKSLDRGFSTRMVKDYLVPHGNVCYAGKESSIVVGSDGTLYKCTVAFEDPRNHVGRLTPEGELEIDQARWDLWTKLDDKDTMKCGSCAFHPACQSRTCPLVAISDKEPPCPVTTNAYRSLVRLVVVHGRQQPVAASGKKGGIDDEDPTNTRGVAEEGRGKEEAVL